jgi:hypothetical protein
MFCLKKLLLSNSKGLKSKKISANKKSVLRFHRMIFYLLESQIQARELLREHTRPHHVIVALIKILFFDLIFSP